MKKIYLMAALAATMGMTSCGSKTGANTEGEDTLVTEVAELPAEEITGNAVATLVEKVKAGDKEGVAAAVEQMKNDVQKAIETGDVEAAKNYASQIQAFVEENKEKLQDFNLSETSLQDLINLAKAVPGNVEDAANAGIEAAKADADAAAEAVKTTAEEKANEAAEAAKNKANEEINNAAQKAADETNKAVNDAANKLKSGLGL